MTMTKQSERLPPPVAKLERLAEYYDTHDTSAEMEPGHWRPKTPRRRRTSSCGRNWRTCWKFCRRWPLLTV